MSSCRPASEIILCEQPGNHADGGHVVYRDAHIRFIRTANTAAYAEFVEALRQGRREGIARYAENCSNGIETQKPAHQGRVEEILEQPPSGVP